MFDLKDIIMAAPLGDARRNKRALEIVTNMVQGEGTGTADHVHASGSASAWAHTMGSTRFYDNEDVLLPNLYEASRKALTTLVPPGHRAYVIYDVSPVDYSHHEAKDDRIQVGNEYGKGYELFSALVVDEEGRPLGPVMQEVHTAHGCLSSEGFQPFPFVDHYEQVERGVRAARLHLPDRDLVSVMDREFDDLALQRWLGNIPEKYVIRALQLDRRVLLHGHPTTLGNAVHAARRVVAGELEREGKVYEVRLAETRVMFHGLSWRGHKHGRPPQKGPPLPVRIVIVELYRRGHRAHQWVLLTNLDEPAEKIAQIYTWRWRVERLFYLLKVGIRMPQWEEQTGERIARRLALACLAATLIYQLQRPPLDPLKLALTRKIATIGGWLGRKCDPIGPVVLMRGMLRLLEAMALLETHGADGLRALGEELAHALGLPVPGVGPPLRRTRRPHRHAHRSPAAP